MHVSTYSILDIIASITNKKNTFPDTLYSFWKGDKALHKRRRIIFDSPQTPWQRFFIPIILQIFTTFDTF